MPPVVLDLDGDEIEIVPLFASTAAFDFDRSGQRVATAWVGADDGLLALDLAVDGGVGPDGMIDQANEIVFSFWAPGSDSDLEARGVAFDSNHDGRLDAAG